MAVCLWLPAATSALGPTYHSQSWTPADLSGLALTVSIAPSAPAKTLHIVRGTVSSGGAVLDGSGFTATRSGTGDYFIRFNTPFATPPAVTASVEYENVFNPGRIAMADEVSASGGNVIVLARDPTSGGTSLVDGRFNFIAIGTR